MFGRGFLFVVVLAAAFLVPYGLSKRGEWDRSVPHRRPGDLATATNPFTRWWDSMWSDSLDDRTPIASATPLPNHRQFSGASGQRIYRQYSQNRFGNQTAPQPVVTGQPHFPNQSNQHPMATPWVPMGRVGIPNGMPVSGPQAGLPNGASAGPWTPVNGTTTRGVAPGMSAFAPPVQELHQLVSFDVTTDWVMQNWDRVTTDVWDGKMEGMRVALVSGTQVHDLAGSLTYYFDQQQILQRIEFQGTSGSADAVKQLATRLGLQPRPSYGGMTLVGAMEDGTETDVVRFRPISGRAASQFQRYGVVMELNRPGSGAPLTESSQRMLRAVGSLPSLDAEEIERELRRHSSVEPANGPFPHLYREPGSDPRVEVSVPNAFGQ